jgi:glycosyltransferase involved in cell wall biosynthesis
MVIRGRKKIGIVFNFSGSWLGGVYYVQNIIKALNHIKDEDKPEIIIFYKKELVNFTENIDYPYLKTIEWQFVNAYKGFLLSWVLRKNVFLDSLLKEHNLDGIYPVYDLPVSNKNFQDTIIAGWFPDLQHKFYPNYFNKLNLVLREFRLKLLLKNADVLVLSSQDVANHFNKFYKIPKKLKIHVMPFVSIIDNWNFENLKDLKMKYKLPEEYFMVSNQFYVHKNHITILKAISLLKKKNKNIHVVFTGKMEHYKNPKFIESLKQEIESNNLSDMVSLLGVIPRQDQLSIMKGAKAIIQPSLFEGWSTVIEDAKSLQVPVIASNIDVHKEQMEDRGVYFEATNELDLANVLIDFSNQFGDTIFDSYEKRVFDFGYNFTSIFK